MLNRTRDIRVINYNSGDRNGVSLSDGNRYITKYARLNPCKYTFLYPHTVLTTNVYSHTILDIFHTILPALIADLVLRLIGQKPMMYKISKLFKTAVEAGI